MGRGRPERRPDTLTQWAERRSPRPGSAPKPVAERRMRSSLDRTAAGLVVLPDAQRKRVHQVRRIHWLALRACISADFREGVTVRISAKVVLSHEALRAEGGLFVRIVVESILVAAALLGFSGLAVPQAAAQSQVVLETEAGRHRLLREGKPYFIKGVGGDTYLDLLVAAGGNSIRTWGTDNLRHVLDEAHRRQLTVSVGLWLGHERHGFNYQDEAAVVEQLNACLDAVRRFKEHPAVLMWSIGNEAEGNGKNPAIWYAINHIAREIKKLDPDHPTMTVIAELGDHKVQSIERFCPDIDIVGVNSYGGISTLAERYRRAGSTKPYVVTEFGPHGPWEVGKTAWGSAIEVTSTEKERAYQEGYQQAVADQPGMCLGSYAFLWGHKQETTTTWFGMLLPDGTRLGAVDAMTVAWTGKPPANRCPQIKSLTLDRTSHLKPRQVIAARLSVRDPEQDALEVKWILRHDAGIIGVGGDPQAEEIAFADAVAANGNEAAVTVPLGGGGYRLYAYVFDGHGGAAVANVPFHVDAPIVPIASPRASLPFVLYGDQSPNPVYIPSGYMGNTAAMTLDSNEKPHTGQTCLKVEYKASDKWGGVLWQSPANDWDGMKPGGLNLVGADELEFWARGADGGETVDFVLGVLDGDQPYRDTAKGELKNVKLTPQWQKLRIPLDGRDLSRIKTGFGWSLAGQGKPVTFYLDNIRYVASESK